ncbi:MAG TPA: amylo-alpha-1,6-glucosidase [Ramlibacter sp.]
MQRTKRKIQFEDQWYVLATLAHPEEPPQVLKNGQTFGVFDRFGDIGALVPGQQGLYHRDTRHLSHLEVLVEGVRPLQLGAAMEHANSVLGIDLMNTDISRNGQVLLAKGTLHLHRSKLLREGACIERLRVTNHGADAAEVRLDLTFGADFVDLFEVRGMQRARRGDMLEPQVHGDAVVLSYRGLDARVRRTVLRFDPPPQAATAQSARFELTLAPAQHRDIEVQVLCECEGESAPRPVDFATALAAGRETARRRVDAICCIETSNPLANMWLERSSSDLAMLTTDLPSGPYPFAGVPWYSTTFGRDGIITAIECLWMDPAPARGVLRFLADTQAQELEPARDAEPGKILHEARLGEMAATREIPFGRYYGSVDSTPLFVLLAALYWQRTGDAAFLRSIWPHVIAALDWIAKYGDIDGDGFVEYARRSRDGLTQQGWKDSHDSIFHRDGSIAPAPIALCEVQGYVYEARRRLAPAARALGDPALAARLEDEAEDLRQRFEQAFWCEELGMYAIALDGNKRRCEVLSSNPGHCLWTGIASPERAARVTKALLSRDFFCGWGIRTIAYGQSRYNPMSYHNGSVWPHDTALAALGMARYGHTREAVQVATALFDASLHFDIYRVPELFCGFERRDAAGPTRYPVACSPQAWAAAAPFALMQACLGIEVHDGGRSVVMHSPRLPSFVDWVRLRRVGAHDCHCDLLLQRHENSVGVEVLRKHPGMRVTVIA